jgi:hypothetical protein
MDNKSYQIIGVYPIVPTETSILNAAKYHEYDFLMDADGKFVDEIYWENHEDLGLLELQVFGAYSPGVLSEVYQNDQAPYMEFYLDPTRIECISEDEAVRIDGRRVCFFLHFMDSSKPLNVNDQELTLPTLSDLPERLVPFTHYLPVD